MNQWIACAIAGHAHNASKFKYQVELDKANNERAAWIGQGKPVSDPFAIPRHLKSIKIEWDSVHYLEEGAEFSKSISIGLTSSYDKTTTDTLVN